MAALLYGKCSPAAFPRCGSSWTSEVLKLLLPGLLGVSQVALQRHGGESVNVGVEGRQTPLVPVERGSKRRRGALLSGDLAP